MAFIKQCIGNVSTCCVCGKIGQEYIDGKWYCTECSPETKSEEE